MELLKQNYHLEHNRTNENNEIFNLKEIRRRKWLRVQLELNNPNIPRNTIESLERFYFFITQHTSIKSIDFIDTVCLIKYINQSAKKEFKEISLPQTIKDIKHLLHFLINFRGIKHPPEIDLSLQNIELWTKL
ncbi:hypothetical protein [Cytobacillus firmus]|uniref:hypothetical protein n=1 Tax=Cytobacillus firmus TaxID=1399 RepID=UPI0018CD23B5|nr:hypothetical protein [Cytobacillus firmus]MBG9587247.1 hypothetical protein [Cytobacillus firmus]